MKTLLILCIVKVSLAVTAGCGSQPSANEQHASGTRDAVMQPQRGNQATHLPAETTIELGSGVNLAMVLIPAGSFLMGDNAGLDDERPAHRVRITRPIYMGKHEVTIAQFRQFVAATNYVTDAEKGTGFDGAFGWNHDTAEFEMRDEYSWRTTGFAQQDDHPVVNVSWNDAAEFSRWLEHIEGRVIRLPTEAEWEYACRAGTTTDYFSGNEVEDVVHVGNVADAAFAEQFPELEGAVKTSDGHVYTAPVGSFPANAFGLFDMHGNAWEWCADWFAVDYYSQSPADNPTGPMSGEERVYRGGGWFNCARGFRSSSRSGDRPENRHLTLGFRLVAPVH